MDICVYVYLKNDGPTSSLLPIIFPGIPPVCLELIICAFFEIFQKQETNGF